MTHLGRRVESDLKPGQVGTVVNENAPAGRWPRSEQSFDVLWDDGSCSRRVARSLLEGAGWTLRSDARRSRSECHDLWWGWISAHARALGELHTRSKTAPQPESRPLPTGQLPGFDLPASAPASIPPATSAKLAREKARTALAQAFPNTAFALHCERRVLSVTWMDGPLAGAVWKVLGAQADNRSVERIRNQRTVSEPLLQAAVDYCLWHAIPDETKRAQAALRINAAAFQDNSMDGLFAQTGAAAGLSFRDLVRVVIGRWDDDAMCFRATRATVGLAAESAAMFPNGLAAAAEQFKLFRAVAASAVQRGRDAVDMAGREALHSLSSARLERQRP